MKREQMILVFLLCAACLALHACRDNARAHLSGERTAVFYPENFDPAGTLPSLALLEEPRRTGALPGDWEIKPTFETRDGKSIVTIAYDGRVDLYGTGEVVGPLRRNGTSTTTWNLDNYAYGLNEGKNLYQSHPWILGVRPDGTSFGILADNTWRQEIELSNPMTITSDGPPFRVIVIERDSPREVVKALASLTGKMELPPLWALGFQQSRWSYYPDARVKEIADGFRQRSIPCDVIWMDIDYMDGFRVFTFDSTRFPRPAELNDYLHANHFKAVYMIDPGVKKDSTYSVYRQGTGGNHWVLDQAGNEYNGSVWPGPCAFPDFTRPETRAWWETLYADFLATGIDGVWNDMNEPAVFRVETHTMPEDNVHRGGGALPAGPHARYHNVYGMLMVQATRDALLAANPGKRPFVLSRANHAGGQRYAATWTGDNVSTWEHLKMSIPMTLNLGLSGQPFTGADIGGFGGNADAELLAHWMAIGAYYPFARNHSASGTIDQEPWAFDKCVEAVSRGAINRRYALLPYLYTLFREAAETGLPVARPLFFADERDTTLRDEQQAFLLGDDLMIIPAWAEAAKRPGGKWVEFSPAPGHDNYQPRLFIRPGAIIPARAVVQSTALYVADSITLIVNPGDDGSAAGFLYDDDGDGFGYKQGDYALHHFTASRREGGFEINVRQVEGNRKVNRHYRLEHVSHDGLHSSAWLPGDGPLWLSDTAVFVPPAN
jgi:alpha-glucosidase